MTKYFVRRADDGGNDASDGLAWDSAKATLVGALVVATTAGDIIACASDLTDTVTGDPKTYAGSSTVQSPKVLISATKAASGDAITYAGDATTSAGAQITDTSGDIAFTPSWRIYGMRIVTDEPSADVLLTYGGPGVNQYYGCFFKPTARLNLQGNYNRAECYGCSVASTTVGSEPLIALLSGYGVSLEWTGGVITYPATTAGQPFLSMGTESSTAKFYGVDLSSLEDVTLVASYGSGNNQFSGFYGCKIPSTFTLPAAGGRLGSVILIERSANADREQTAAGLCAYWTNTGTITHDTATYRTGGESLPGYSWKAVGNATYCSYYNPLVSPPIAGWCDGDNSASHTVTVEFASDTELTDATIWFDILYPAETATHQDGYASTRRAVGAAGEAYANGNSWTGLGATYWYSKTWTITPDFPGPVTVRAYVATAEADIYICPKLDVT